MAEEGVSYELLQELLRSERRSNKLSRLPARFWMETRQFLLEVEDEFRAEQEKDPFSRRVMMLTDRVKNARHAAEAVWTLRERKLALRALAHAKEGERPEGLTPGETELYDELLKTLQANRDRVFAGTSASRPPAPVKPAPRASTPPAPPTGPAADDEPEPAAETKPAGVEPSPDDEVTVVPADTPEDDVTTIRALGDIPPFVGPDMQTYILQGGDVASVPPSIAELLVRRGKAAVVND